MKRDREAIKKNSFCVCWLVFTKENEGKTKICEVQFTKEKKRNEYLKKNCKMFV